MAKVTQLQELTTAQIADRLGITPLAVRGLIKRGHFPNVRKLPAANATYLIPYSDFENYLAVREARKRQKSATAAESG